MTLKHPLRPPMTLGNICYFDICVLMVPTLLLAPLSIGANADPDRITCTGILTEAETRTSAWPLAVIQDTGGHYMCRLIAA